LTTWSGPNHANGLPVALSRNEVQRLLDRLEGTHGLMARRLDAGEDLPETNYHLGFESAAQLFAELTPQRMRLLESLKATGPQSIYALTKQLGRNYSNVHRDVKKLMEYRLVVGNKSGQVRVPWQDVLIRVSLAHQAA
jgi:predicted transcriptional regulator